MVVLSKDDYKSKLKFIECTLYAPTTDPDWRLLWIPQVYDLDDSKAFEIMLKMASIGMIAPVWVDDQYRFTLGGGSWGAFLNGRPA